jgi:PQQ-dependent dehydrogenase (methanol/ethanol family)
MRRERRDRGQARAPLLGLFALLLVGLSQPLLAQQNQGTRYISDDNTGMRIPRTPSSGPKGEWWLPALDFANSRYSELDQINAENVQDLQVVTTWSTGIPRGHEGNPLVVGSTMYVVTPFPNYLMAFDMTKPGYALKWKFEPHPDPTAVGKACCDLVNRGAAYADGKVVYNTLDNHTVAVDAKTGQLVWKTKLGNVNEGETMTMAPIIVKDKVIVGNSGAELGVRGWLKALSLETGEVLWIAYNTGTDEETLMTDPRFKPYYKKDQGDDLGLKTWPPEQWKLGGSTVWGWVSYDPELDLLFYGTGIPACGIRICDSATTSGPSPSSPAIPTTGRPVGPTRSFPTRTGTTTRSWRTSSSTCPGRVKCASS